MNATAIGAVQRGFLTVFPCGDRPEASSVNYEGGGPAVANEVIAKVSDEGTVCVFNQRDLDIVLDVVGYIGAADTETRAVGEASSVVSLVPARVLETRADRPTADGLFEGIGRRSARQVTEVDVLDRVGVPGEGVEAVVMNATAIGAFQRGFLTVFPCGERPEASSVNYEAGGPAVANEVIAKVSDDGTVCVFNQRDLDIVLDVVGYVGAADTDSRAAGDPSSVVSLVPARVLETRAGRPTADGQFEGIGRRSARQVTEVEVLGRVGVPADGVEAVVMNATAIGAVQRGFLTVFPCGERPEASSVNHEAGGPAVANEVIAKVSDQGTVCVFNQRELDIVLDVVGYISSIPAPTDPPPVDPPPVDPPPPPDGDVVVPDVVGLQQGQAIERIVDETLMPGLGGSRHDDAPAGEVIEQTPVGGSRVDEGDDVAFVLSLGPELVTVPDVLGDDEATARGNIEAADLTVGDVGAGESDDYDVGDVNLQLPLAGQQVLPGTPVDVTLTTGLVNDPPEITTNPVLDHEVGGEYVYDVDATDPENDPITFILQAGPLDEQGDPLAQIDPTTGVLTWTPTTNDAGPVDVAVRAEDQNGGIDVQSFTLNVSVPNRPPTPEDDVYGVAINDVLTVDADTGVLSNDTDPDDDELTAEIVDDPANGQVAVAGDGSFVYTPFQRGSDGIRFSDIDLTRFSLEDVETSSNQSASLVAANLVDGYVEEFWVAAFGTTTAQVTLSFEEPVAPATLDLLGIRGSSADSGLGLREVDLTLLDGDGATILSLPGQVFPPNDDGDDDVDADLTVDLAAAAGGSAPEGVSTVVIDIVDTDGGRPGLGEVVLTGEGTRRNLSPDIQWSWTDPNGVFGAAMQSPTVGDLDGDGFPEVLFLSATPTFSSSSTAFLYAMDGRDGSLKWVTDQILRSTSAPVLGDLNNDGFLEVVTVGSSATPIVVFDHEGNEIGRTSSLGVLGNLALADLDGDGAAEIVSGSNNQVIALTVTFDEFGDVTISERWRTPVAKGCGAQGGTAFCVPVVADVDLDGEPEIVAGNRVVGFDGSIEHDSGLADGFVAVGNFDDDPEAEIVHVSAGNVRLLNHDLSIVWGPVPIPEGGRGGPPTVGDYDSDGQPEIGVAGSARYFVLDSDGTELWQATTVDGSSNVTGSTIFDFDDDGTTEVVYRDEQNLWIFDGPTGAVRFKTPIRSFTLIEYPVVADVDADGQAEIVVPSDANQTLPDGTTREKGLYVFEGALGDWVRARSIWNQHSYHVTNVNDDGTIPAVESANWLDGSLNNFREQSFPSDEFAGLDSFTYRVSDASGATSDATAYVEVRPPQNDPVVTCTPPATATVGFEYVGRVCASDPDGDELTVAGAARLSTTADVLPRAHPWLAGQPDGATLLGDGAPDDSPVLAATAEFFAAGDALTFTVSGNAGTDFSTVYGPDGAGDALFGAQNGLAGLRAPFAAAVGVFLSDDVPDPGSAPPPTLDFRPSALGVDFPSLSPLLGQPFFIGDGRTPDGVAQQFVVPGGATRLFVGVMDDNVWATNPGDGYEVTVVSPTDAGVVVDPASGVVTWTPSVVGSYRLVGSVADDTARSTPFAQTITVDAPIEVPDLVGSTEADARFAIEAAGLRVGGVDVAPSVDVPADEVLDQFPPGGSIAARDARVAITVSSGSSPADFDGDSDGFTPNQGDCNDADATINPGEGEIDGDAVDSNCDGEDDDLGVVAVGITGVDNDLPVGRSRSFAARALLADGRTVDITELATFASTEPSVATVAGRTATAITAGAFGVTATYSGLTATKLLTAIEPLPTDDTPPVAEITAPLPGDEISAEIDIIGTASDDNLTGWTLSAVAEDGSIYTEIAADTDSVVGDVLSTLSAAAVPPGVVTLRLDVEDGGGNISRTEVPVIVLAGAQPGAFSLLFNDLTVPVSGIPLSVDRVYDSRDRRQGDFGAGWSLGLSDLDLRVSPNQGRGWEIVSGRFGSSALQPTAEHSVTISLPNGRQEVFDLQPSPRTSSFVPLSFTRAVYVPRLGTTGSLVPTGNSNLLVLQSATDVQLVDDTTLRSYDPPGFVYTSLDGTAFTVDADGTIRRIEDPNGNVMTISDDGITHSAGKSVVFERDAFGRIVSITDPGGNVQSYSYSAAGDLIAHTDAEGSVVTFVYADGHRLVEVIDPLGRLVERREYDDQGRLAAIISAGGERTAFTYDTAGQTQVVTDSDGNETTFTYDLDGNVLSVVDPFGGTTTNTYDANGNQLTSTDPLGRTTTRTFDADGNELTATDAAGGVVTRTYNDNGEPLSEQDALGRTTTFEYDARGNRVRTIDPAGGVQEVSFDAFGNVISVVEPDGATTTNTYDQFGRQVSTTRPDGATTTTEYDDAGNPVAITGPAVGSRQEIQVDARGNPTQITDATGATTQLTLDFQGVPTEIVGDGGGAITQQVDASGNPTSVGLPDGTTRTLTYTPSGQLETETDGDGGVTTHTYDAFDRRVSTEWPDGTISSKTYDLAGQTATEIDRNGQTTIYGYDAAGRRTTATDPTGSVVTYEYDLAGNRIAEVDPVGGRTEFEYDDRNRLVRTRLPDGTTEDRTYDSVGNLIRVTGQDGETTVFTYDAGSRLVEVVDPLGGVSTATYDAAGNQTSITDANGNTTRYEYDAAGRLVTTTFPSGVSERATYDGQGLPLTTTDRNGEVTAWAFDGLGRPVSRTGPDGSAQTFAYDGTGALISATDSTGTTTYTVDAVDRVTGIAHPDGTALSYTYDSAGNRTSVTANLPGGTSHQTNYAYDPAGRMVAVTDHASNTTTYAYDPAGRQTLITRPNGTTTATTYDPLHRATLISHDSGSGVLERFAYQRNTTGDPIEVVQADGSVATYVYDAARRLTGETHLDGSVLADRTYTYDAVSNRTEQIDSVAGTTTTYTYDVDDRLLTAGTDAFVYDGRGSQLSMSSNGGTTLYGYDDRALLTTAVLPNGTVVGYAIDALGTRVVADGVSLLVDPLAPTGVPEVLIEHAGGQLIASYTYGTDLLSVERGGATFYAHADEIGSVRLATDNSGTVVAATDYTAFGEQLGSTGTMPWPHGFVGERQDARTGLYHLRARQYQPQTGLFTTVDPDVGTLDDPRTRHPYLYAEAAPLSYADPTGLFSVSLTDVSIASAIAAGVSAAIFAPAGADIKERAQRAVVAAGLAGLSTLAVLSLTGALIGSIVAAVTATGPFAPIVGFVVFIPGLLAVAATYITLSIFFGILSSCVLTAGFEAKLCDLPVVAFSTAFVTVGTLGLGAQLGPAAQGIARRVIDFVFDVLPAFATDFLGSKLPPS